MQGSWYIYLVVTSICWAMYLPKDPQLVFVITAIKTPPHEHGRVVGEWINSQLSESKVLWLFFAMMLRPVLCIMTLPLIFQSLLTGNPNQVISWTSLVLIVVQFLGKYVTKQPNSTTEEQAEALSKRLKNNRSLVGFVVWFVLWIAPAVYCWYLLLSQ